MTVTIEQGDGTMGRRLALGHCPKCNTAMPEDSRSECRVCGLKIGSSKAQDNGVLDPPSSTPLIDTESVISMTGALK